MGIESDREWEGKVIFKRWEKFMHIIVCLDNKDGMLFNKRRQSKDAVLMEKILELVGKNRLCMNEYSAKQFEEKMEIFVSENFLETAQKGDYCFVENIDISMHAGDVENVIIYRWNRDYPSDVRFPTELFTSKRKFVKSTDFAGKSHPKITEEIYEL